MGDNTTTLLLLAAATDVTTARQACSEGYVTSVQPLPGAGLARWPTGGALYVQVGIVPQGDTDFTRAFGILWADYVRKGESHVSIPNAGVSRGQDILAIMTAATTGDDGQTVNGLVCNVRITISDAPAPGTAIHTAAPATGAGVRRRIAMGAIAAGQAFYSSSPSIAGAAKLAWRFVACAAQLITDANVALRIPRSVIAATGPLEFAVGQANQGIAAGTTTQIRASLLSVGTTVDSAFVSAPIPDIGPVRSDIGNASLLMGIALDRVQAGDQFSAGILTVDEWAVP